MKSKGKSKKNKSKGKGILVQEGSGSGRGKQTRSITWKPELEETKYFESDENERSNSAKFENLRSIESEIENAPRHSEPNGSICIENSFHHLFKHMNGFLVYTIQSPHC